MRREILLLEEMIGAIEQIIKTAADVSEDELSNDKNRRDALLWNFTVLGEASGQLSEEFKNEYSAIPWIQPSRLRNRIVHGYWSIDLSILLTVASDELPEFLVGVRSVLNDLL